MSKLGDFCINITDGEHGTVKDIQDIQDRRYYLLSNKNIINSKIQIDGSDRTISKADYEKINKRTKLEHEDVVIATVGTIGKTAILDRPSNYVFQRSVGIIKTNKEKLNPYYLKYQIDTPNFQKRLQLLSKGGVQKCIFINDLKGLDVKIPPIKEQEEIISILKNIDSKTESNNAIISELESLAKDIYDYWFTQFDFPDENGKPYKSSGGKMVWNEELKREIPAIWKNGELNSFSYLRKEQITPQKGFIYEHYSIPAFDQDKCPIFNCGDEIASSKYIVKPSSILVSKLNPQFPRVWLPLMLTQRAICSTEFLVLEPNEQWGKSFLYFFLKSNSTIKAMVAKASSSTGSRKRVSPGEVMKIPIVMPDKNNLMLFSSITTPFLLQIVNLQKENMTLNTLRNFLLPLLMNGQVTVGVAEK